MASCRLATTYEQAKRANFYNIYALITPYKRTGSFQFHNNDISFISTHLNYAWYCSMDLLCRFICTKKTASNISSWLIYSQVYFLN